MSADRELLATIHAKAANCLATADVLKASGLFNCLEEIWNLTLEASEAVHGPSGDDGRDFSGHYEP